MRIAVTGGAGFIGSNFVRYWMDTNPADEVVVIDALTYAGHLSNLAGYHERPHCQFVQADICDYQTMLKVLAGVNLVVHFAAETHVDRSLGAFELERQFYRSNIEGTASLIRASREAGVGHFHHVSTDEVFGDLAFDDPQKFHETYPYNPSSPYAVSKAASDHVVRAFAHTYNYPITITNCTNNYGPFQTPEKLIPRSIALLLANQKVKLYTDADGIPGRNIRDWLHVQDHCEAIALVIKKGRIGETYGIGGEAELSNFHLVETMLDIMSEFLDRSLTVENSVEFVADRPGHDRRYAMDLSKIKRELGWQPRYSFEQGFLETVQWYTSPEGQAWLASLSDRTSDVRANQEQVVAVRENWQSEHQH
ncbi:dTDP-glucose 4,6-dehydratase [Herpetosiphon llansteffanensis]|uniref:dTDP-glucose 4,6-dehydratase n=1 Tax=Herpetosiphon llansteffanensis TaxID=2094568 RepID=UPI000D7CB36D|nr:dTDP-glucose 4,6-dehydratase [Herpetosiphon llansteffanensis]